jgi:F-type H+-transporting ATPase subunit delta
MSRRIARPYATALYQVMSRRGIPVLREIEGQLATIAEVLRRQPKLLRAFEVPTVPPATKRELLAELVRSMNLAPETGRLLAALMQHYRLRFLPEVVSALRARVDREEGKVRGRVVLPTEPEKDQVERLAAALQESIGSRVDLATEVDPGLLAGFVVQLGSQVFDGSLRTRIKKFAASTSTR